MVTLSSQFGPRRVRREATLNDDERGLPRRAGPLAALLSLLVAAPGGPGSLRRDPEGRPGDRRGRRPRGGDPGGGRPVPRLHARPASPDRGGRSRSPGGGPLGADGGRKAVRRLLHGHRRSGPGGDVLGARVRRPRDARDHLAGRGVAPAGTRSRRGALAASAKCPASLPWVETRATLEITHEPTGPWADPAGDPRNGRPEEGSSNTRGHSWGIGSAGA